MTISYRGGYKYQLAEDYSINVDVRHPVETEFLVLLSDGDLLIKAGYAWDGPSGPTIDTKNFMRGSLVHDALYQLMREGHIPEDYREHADSMLREICREDGMTAMRAWWVYRGVRFGGGSSAARGADRPVLTAP